MVNLACIQPAGAWYSIPNTINPSISSFFQYLNCASVTSPNIFWSMMAFTIFAIFIFAMTKTRLMIVRVMVSAFTTTLLSAMLAVLNLVSIYIPIIFSILAAVSTIVFYFTTSQ